MRQAIGLLLVAVLLGGCVAYVGPYSGRPIRHAYVHPDAVVIRGR